MSDIINIEIEEIQGEITVNVVTAIGEAGPQGEPGSDASVTNESVNTAIANNPDATKTAIGIPDEITAAKARANHTGTQSIATVDLLQAALDGKATAAQGSLADSALQPGEADLTLQTIAEDPAAVQLAAGVDSSRAKNTVPVYLSIPHPYTGVDPTSVNSVNHPSVLDLVELGLPNGMGGFRYVMAFTPYVGLNPPLYENPCIVVSNDKINWSVPVGLTNPIDDNAGAVSQGFDYWSDPELLLDGSTLVCYYRPAKNAVADRVYAKTTTDLVTWSSRILVKTGPTFASMLSPTVIKEDDGTYSMWVVDSGLGGVFKRTSSSPTSGWSSEAQVTTPNRAAFWHIQVRKYAGVYYMLANTNNRNTNNPAFVHMLYSFDGDNWFGDGNSFLISRGDSLDVSGYYRCAMIPRGGFPAMFDIWAVAITSDVNQWHIFYTEKSYQPSSRRARRSSLDVDIRDYFLGGAGGTADNTLIGDLSWVLKNGVGTGSVYPGLKGNDTSGYGLGGIRITTASSSGSATGIKMAGGAWNYAWYTDNFMRLSDSVWTVTFKANTSAAGDTFLSGFGSQHLPATAPGRWIGMRTVKGTDTNFQFYLADTTIDPVKVDLGVPLDSGWHTFEMGYDRPVAGATRGNWRARMDNRPWIIIPNSGLSSSDHSTTVTAIGNAQVSPVHYCVSGTAAAAIMDIEFFRLQGFMNQY